MAQKRHAEGKPIYVMEALVQLVTPGRTIVDPYMGSGTTLVAALRHGYPAIGIDIKRTYFDDACAWVEEEWQALQEQGAASA